MHAVFLEQYDHVILLVAIRADQSCLGHSAIDPLQVITAGSDMRSDTSFERQLWCHGVCLEQQQRIMLAGECRMLTWGALLDRMQFAACLPGPRSALCTSSGKTCTACRAMPAISA